MTKKQAWELRQSVAGPGDLEQFREDELHQNGDWCSSKYNCEKCENRKQLRRFRGLLRETDQEKNKRIEEERQELLLEKFRRQERWES